MPNLRHGPVGGVGQGLEEAREHAVEHDAGEALGDALLVTLALVEGGLDEAGGGAGAAQKGGAAKEQVEGAEGILVVGLEEGLEVGFVEGGGARAGFLVVEPPDGAVGEDAPAEVAVGDGFGGGQVAQDLGVG